MDSLPAYACQSRRGGFRKRSAGPAGFGKDLVVKQTFYGFRLPVRASRDGVIQAIALAPANVAEIHLVRELGPPAGSVGLGDRGYWSPETQAALAAGGITLLAPFRLASKDPDRARTRALSRQRRRIETVLGQLAERMHVKRTWARDLWHLCHRIIRKVLCHTVAAYVNASQGRSPITFDALLAA